MLNVAAAPAAAGEHECHLDEDLAAVVQWGSRSPFGSMQRDRQTSPRPILSAKDPNACSPTCATTPVPPDSTLTRVVEVLCISKVPSVFGDWLVSKHQYSLHRGHFRGLTAVSSRLSRE